MPMVSERHLPCIANAFALLTHCGARKASKEQGKGDKGHAVIHVAGRLIDRRSPTPFNKKKEGDKEPIEDMQSKN